MCISLNAVFSSAVTFFFSKLAVIFVLFFAFKQYLFVINIDKPLCLP